MYLWILLFVLIKISFSVIDVRNYSFCYQLLLSGIKNPRVLTHDYEHEHYLYLAEHIGEIYVIDNSKSPPGKKLFLNITKQTFSTDEQGDERGLLGFTFHPDFKTNGYLFVQYSSKSSDKNYDHVSTISRFKMSSENAKVDELSEQKLLEIPQPGKRQNGGQLFFGSDGYLYVTVGDGGDKRNKRFSKNSYLGKILRIDVNGPNNLPYSIPPSNPFINEPQDVALPEIFAYGFRNPWGCSVDRGGQNQEGRGRIFCGDAGGERNVEEISIIDKGGQYGWMDLPSSSCKNLEDCLNNMASPLPPGYKLPIYDYNLKNGQAVIGGYVYRGQANPVIQGLYLFADYVTGSIFYLQEIFSTGRWSGNELKVSDEETCRSQGLIGQKNHFVLAFGENLKGEVFILAKDSSSSSPNNGVIYKIITSHKEISNTAWLHSSPSNHFVFFIFFLYIFI